MPKYKRRRPQLVAERLRWLAPHADAFQTWLSDKSYSPVTIIEMTRLLSCWAEWMSVAGFDLHSIEAGLASSAAVFRSSRTARAPLGVAQLFLACLRERGILPPATPVPRPEDRWPVLGRYRDWMREHRGVAESTLDLRQRILVDLLGKLGDDPAAYTATAIRAFVLERAQPHGRGHAQTIAVATRSFLQYLIATGQCPSGRDDAVPGFANWQLSSTPRCYFFIWIDQATKTNLLRGWLFVRSEELGFRPSLGRLTRLSTKPTLHSRATRGSLRR